MSNQSIHPSAVIHPSAQIGSNVSIGAYTVVGPDVIIGDGTTLYSHVVIESNTTIGKDCSISSMAVLGGTPQDNSFKNEATRVIIGDRVRLREFVTVQRATGEGNNTIIGDDCFLMAYCHVAHNCKLGKGVTMANNAQLAGHIELGDFVVLGGFAGLHQNIRVGRMAMIGAVSGSRYDVPPFALVDGARPTLIRGLNKVALKRQGVSLDDRLALKRAFQKLFFSELNVTQAIEYIKENQAQNPYVDELLEFMQTSRRHVLTTTIRKLNSNGRMEMEDSERDMLEDDANETQQTPSLVG